MSATQSIIVYRGPLEAMIWENLMNSNMLFPIFAGCFVAFISIVVLYTLAQKFLSWRWERKINELYLPLIIGGAIGVFTVYIMI